MDIIYSSTQANPATCGLYEWFNITAIRVLHVWNDVQVKRLVITMIDKNVSYNTITLISPMINFMLHCLGGSHVEIQRS